MSRIPEIPERGIGRYVSIGVLATALWGLTFGALDGALATVDNWTYALFSGVVFALVMFVADR